MSLGFVVGQAKSGKTDYILNEIINNSINNPDINHVLIVPDQFLLEMEALLIKKHPKHAFFNIDILGFNRIAYRIFEEKRYTSKPMLDEMGRLLILRKIYEENKSSFLFYDKKIAGIGFINEIKSVISEFMQYGINEAILSELLSKLDEGLTYAKIHDLAIIYKAFLNVLGDSYSTSENVLLEACSMMNDTGFVKNTRFYIDDFSTFTPLQILMTERLMKSSMGVTVSIPMPCDVFKRGCKKHELFYVCYEMYLELKTLANAGDVKLLDTVFMENSVSGAYKAPEIQFLSKNLFSGNKKFEDECRDISIIETETPLDEIRCVASKIMDLTLKGVRFRDIAVICDNSDYNELIYRTFTVCGINAYLDMRKSCFMNPYVAFLRNALKIVSEDYSYDAVMGYLKSGLSSFDDIETSLFDNYISCFDIKGFRKYNKEFKASKSFLKHIDELNELREILLDETLPLRDAIKVKNITCDKIVAGIKDFVNNCCLEDRISDFINHIREVSGDFAADVLKDETSRIVEMTDELLSQIERIMGDEKLSLEEFNSILDTGIEFLSIAHVPTASDLVMVGDIRRTRLYDTKYMFLIGANSNIIPKSSSISPALTNRDKEIISSLDVKLAPTAKELAYIERFNLYSILVKATTGLTITYSRCDLTGKAVGASYIIDTFKKMYSKLSIKAWSSDDNDFNIFVNAFDFVPDFSSIKSEYLKKLWKDGFVASVSNIEDFFSCNYKFFLRYTMKLKPSETVAIDGKLLGSIYHLVCEDITKKLIEEKKSLTDFDDDALKQFLETMVEETIKRNYDGVFEENNRNQFLKERLKDIIFNSFMAMKIQMSHGEFIIKYAERAFKRKHEDFKIEGKIDRIDLYEDENENEIFVKIVDYKTYSKNLELYQIFYGIDLQLPLYMKQVLELEKIANDKKEIKPAAMLYSVLKNESVNENDIGNKNFEDVYYEKYIPSGFVSDNDKVAKFLDKDNTSYVLPKSKKNLLSDAQFEKLLEFAEFKLEEGAEAIMNGEIFTNPYIDKRKSSCDYCDYRNICNLCEVGGSKNFRKLNRKVDFLSEDEDGENA